MLVNVKVHKFLFILVVFIFSLGSGCGQDRNPEEYIENGRHYLSLKEWKSAIIEFKNALKLDPENSTARALLGKTYMETQNYNAAIKELNRAIDYGFERSELLLSLGMAYKQAGMHQKLIEEIETANNQPNIEKATINAWRGMAYLSLGNKNAAKDSLDMARKLDGEATEVRLSWASYESFNGNIEAQERWLHPLLERGGGVADAWSQMGQIERKRNNLNDSEKAFTRAINIREIPHYDYLRRSNVRILLGKISGAKSDIEFLKKAGAIWPEIVHAEGLVQFKSKNYANALNHFLKVLSKVPSYEPSQLMAGLSSFYLHNYQSSISYLELYLTKNSENFQASLVYATSLLATKQTQKALKVLQVLNNKIPDNFQVLSLLSDAYFRQGQNVESLENLRKAVKINPQQASTRFQLGSYLVNSNNSVALGQQELIKAIELDPRLNQA